VIAGLHLSREYAALLFRANSAGSLLETAETKYENNKSEAR
jgi:hypothetical protein